MQAGSESLVLSSRGALAASESSQSSSDHQTTAAAQHTPLTTVSFQVHKALDSRHAEKENNPVDVTLTATASLELVTETPESSQHGALHVATANSGRPSAASSTAALLTRASKQSLHSSLVKQSNSNANLAYMGDILVGSPNSAVEYAPRYAPSYEEHLTRCQGVGLSVLLQPQKKVSLGGSFKGKVNELIL